jgi:hypothetical protein
MKQWKRLIYYLLINVLVSACTTFAVLYIWDRTHPPVAGGVLGPIAFNVSGSESVKGTSAALPASGTAQTSVEPITPTSPPTQDPYENAIAYEVKANDILGEIADKFDIEVE